MRNKIIVSLSILTAAAVYMMGCKKMDDTYRQFVENGEIVYVSKADSLEAHSGKNRIELTWLLLSDPKVRTYKVYWDNRTDSVEGPVQKTDQEDTVRVMVDNLDEGIHYFEVYMYGKDGNPSVQASVIGNAYGAIYQGALLPRIIKSASWGENSSIALELTPANQDAVQTEVEYEDKNTGASTFFIPRNVDTATLSDVKGKNGAATIKYRTIFLPDSTAIDTFYSDYTTYKVIKTARELDKSKWSFISLDNDNSSSKSGRHPEAMWDGSVSTNAYITANGTMPQTLTIDLGQQAVLTKFRRNDYWKGTTYRYLYGVGVPKVYEIWASNDISQDGDWSRWTLLGSFESTRPSGSTSTKDDLTDADIEAGKEGETLILNDVDSSFRYIRLKTTDIWYGDKPDPDQYYLRVAELTFWGIVD